MLLSNDTPLNGTHSPHASRLQDWHISEADHRVANSFALLASTISLQARSLSKQQHIMSSDEVSRMLMEIGSRIANVGQLHRKLANRPDGNSLDLNEYLVTICESLIGGLSRPGQVVLFQTTGNACPIGNDKVLPISLIVTEVVSNSLKYAHPAGVQGNLTVGCHSESDGGIVIEVADDGVGMPEGFDPDTDGGIGLQTIRALAAKIGAKASYVPSSIGLRFRLRLPPV